MEYKPNNLILRKIAEYVVMRPEGTTPMEALDALELDLFRPGDWGVDPSEADYPRFQQELLRAVRWVNQRGSG